MINTLADLRGGAGDAPPPMGAKISSFSCSFRRKLTKIIGWRPPQELAPPPRGNPGSATAIAWSRPIAMHSHCIVDHENFWGDLLILLIQSNLRLKIEREYLKLKYLKNIHFHIKDNVLSLKKFHHPKFKKNVYH